MSKLVFITESIKDGAPLDKEWVLRCSAVIGTNQHTSTPYYPFPEANVWVYYDADGARHELFPYKEGEPLFTRDELIAVDNSVVPSIEKGELITTWGVLLLNLLILWYPFGKMVPYWNVAFNPKKVDALWLDLINQGEVTLDQLLLSSAGASQTTAFNTVFTPSYTERTTRICPAADKLLKRLLKEHADKLGDPAVVAGILEQVYQVDKAWIEEDVDGGKGFLISDKSYRVVRMHLLYTQILYSMDGDITTSALKDGLSVAKLPAAINESMKGSMDRGFNTALGGVAVKEILRLLAGVGVKTDDCGSMIGLRFVMTKDDIGHYNGRYLLEGTNKRLVLITKENMKSYLNKEVIMRDPNACKAKTFCKICVGDNVAENANAIKGQGIEWGSVMVSLFMAAMHGKSLVTEDYDFLTSLN